MARPSNREVRGERASGVGVPEFDKAKIQYQDVDGRSGSC